MSKRRMQQGKEGALIKFLKAPANLLVKARDVYVKTMTEMSGRLGPGAGLGHVNTTSPPTGFDVVCRRGTNCGGRDEDTRELIRAASARGLACSWRVQSDACNLGRSSTVMIRRSGPPPTSNKLARKHSAPIGRIDEDRPCEFGDDHGGFNVKKGVFPRSSSSYAAVKHKRMI